MYRTSPVDNNLPSPAQLLNQALYQTQLPCAGHVQQAQAMESHHDQLQFRQGVQRKQYDRNPSCELTKLLPGQQVTVFHPQNKTWTLPEVKGEAGKPRSYIVKTTAAAADGSELRCNRVQLKTSGTLPMLRDENKPVEPSTPTSVPTPAELRQIPLQPAEAVTQTDAAPMTTRSRLVNSIMDCSDIRIPETHMVLLLTRLGYYFFVYIILFAWSQLLFHSYLVPGSF